MIRPKPKPNKHKDLLQFQKLGQNKLEQSGPAPSKVSNVVLFVARCLWAFMFFFLTELGFKSSTYMGTYLYQVLFCLGFSSGSAWLRERERETQREKERKSNGFVFIIAVKRVQLSIPIRTVEEPAQGPISSSLY